MPPILARTPHAGETWLAVLALGVDKAAAKLLARESCGLITGAGRRLPGSLTGPLCGAPPECIIRKAERTQAASPSGLGPQKEGADVCWAAAARTILVAKTTEMHCLLDLRLESKVEVSAGLVPAEALRVTTFSSPPRASGGCWPSL